MRVMDLVLFMQKRHEIYVARKDGDPWPWTDDPILREYRFCNVYRNLDKQTQLIHANWLEPHKGEPGLWFACVVARLVNWWPTLEEVKYPVPWHPNHFKHVLARRKDAGTKVFTGAYMVRADAVVSGSKADYLADYVLNPLWASRKDVRPKDGDTLAAFHSRLMTFRDMGSFMAAQVIADAKFFDDALQSAHDWEWWAAPGPGSLRGLNRVCHLPPDTPWKSGEWDRTFAKLLNDSRRTIVAAGLPLLTGQDLQNCLCEFDKYERVRLGEGKPRSRYQPPKEQVR